MDEKEELNIQENDIEKKETAENSSNSIENPQKTTEEDLSIWEELNDDNSVVKKYIIYISQDFINIMDKMSTDERSAYINDAIQTKIDLEDVEKQKNQKIKLIFHGILILVAAFAILPFAILGANKAIMATFENYKYSQDNFEKLYKNHFEKSKIYARSMEYNKQHNKGKN